MKLRVLLENIAADQKEIKADQQDAKERIAAIEVDLRHHISRTDELQRQVAPLTRIYHFFQVSAGLLVLSGAVAALLRLFIYQ